MSCHRPARRPACGKPELGPRQIRRLADLQAPVRSLSCRPGGLAALTGRLAGSGPLIPHRQGPMTCREASTSTSGRMHHRTTTLVARHESEQPRAKPAPYLTIAADSHAGDSDLPHLLATATRVIVEPRPQSQAGLSVGAFLLAPV